MKSARASVAAGQRPRVPASLVLGGHTRTLARRTEARVAIVDAAARAISRHGYHGMSMRALAGATGYALANFYNHFSSKEEVLYEIQRHAFEALIASAEEAVAREDDPQARLFAFICQHVRYVAGHTDVWRVLVHDAGALPPRRRAAVRALKERYYDLARQIVAQVHRQGCRVPGGGDASDLELEEMTYGVFGMLNWVYGWYQPLRHGPPVKVARALHRLMLSGLGGSAV